MKKFNKNQGVALLYAVLLVSIVLTISLSLLNITYKQIVLTAVSRESQVSHYNALSALDCVYFTDRFFRDGSSGDDTPPNPFGRFTFTESGVNLDPAVGNSSTFSCPNVDGQINASEDLAPGDVSPIGISANGIISRYKMTGPGLIGSSCATVEVVKVRDGDYADFGEGDATDEGKVMTTAFGYNTCDVTSSRRVERRARVRSR